MTAGWKAAIIQEHGKMTYGKRIRQAAHGAGFRPSCAPERLPNSLDLSKAANVNC